MPCRLSTSLSWLRHFLARPKRNRTTNGSNAFCESSRCPAQLALFIVRLLGVTGPYTLALDRTNWKVGAVDLNILMLSIVYRVSRRRYSGCLDRLVQSGQL